MLVIKALNRGVSSNWCANGIHLLRVKAAIYRRNIVTIASIKYKHLPIHFSPRLFLFLS